MNDCEKAFVELPLYDSDHNDLLHYMEICVCCDKTRKEIELEETIRDLKSNHWEYFRKIP